MSALDPREAYRLWAPTYAAETAISFLDEELVRDLSPSPANGRLLDAGCGTGRRLVSDGTALAVGVDISFEMLAAGGKRIVAAADLRALPFAAREFDLIWCRLVLGHLPELSGAYCEMARVCRPGGHLLVSDFHADAVRAGHRRSFRDASGLLHEVEHHLHDGGAHAAVAAQAGFILMASREAFVGPSVEPFYRYTGKEAAYHKDRGLAVIAAFLFRRMD